MDWAAARLNMVEGQVRPNRVTDPAIVTQMLALRREAMVPPARRVLAHADAVVEVGPGRALLSPMVAARLVQEATPVAGQKALVLPGLAAYGGLLLAGLGLDVFALESPELAGRARENLVAAADGAATPTVVAGPLAEGWQQAAPYDVILVEAALAAVPESLTRQLAEGGRLLAVLGEAAPRRAIRIDRLGGSLTTRDLFDAAALPLPEIAAAPAFTL